MNHLCPRCHCLGLVHEINYYNGTIMDRLYCVLCAWRSDVKEKHYISKQKEKKGVRVYAIRSN